jgi:hypothetical protein
MRRILLYVQVFCVLQLFLLKSVHAQTSYYFDTTNAFGRVCLGDAYLQGRLVKHDVDSAIKWYNAALQMNCTNAYASLANIYFKGGAVPQNFEKAVQYYKAGSKLGDVQCSQMLAYCYFKGLGISQSYDSAANIYRPLAYGNVSHAQYFLGMMLRNGYGMPVNNDSAKYWLKKAAMQNHTMAVHELISEPLPENKDVVNAELSKQMETLKKYHEQLESSSANDIGGQYTGYAVYEDFSGKHVQKIVALELDIKKVNGYYSGTWTERSDCKSITADIKGSFNNNQFSFDSSSRYTRNDQYSYENNEDYRFDNASLNIKYIKDSLYLSGDAQFYSLSRRETGQPMFIVLSKKVAQTSGKSPTVPVMGKLMISPNPANVFVKSSFTLNEASRTQILLTDMNGKVLQRISPSLLPAGTYTYSFDIQSLPSGSYIIQVAAQNSSQSKIFIKAN